MMSAAQETEHSLRSDAARLRSLARNLRASNLSTACAQMEAAATALCRAADLVRQAAA